MIQKNRFFAKLLDILSDALLILFSYLAAVHVRFHVLNGVISIPHTSGRVLWIVLTSVVVTVFAYHCLDLYGHHRLVRRSAGIATILSANTLGVLMLATMFFLFRVEDFSRLSLLLFWGFADVLVVSKHELMTQLACRQREVRHPLRVALVGNGRLARQFYRDQAEDPQLGIVVVGYVSAVERPELGRQLGSYEDLPAILEMNSIDCLVVALEAHENRHINAVLSAAEKEGVRVELIPFYNDYLPTHPTIEIVGRTKMINLAATPLNDPGAAFAKRLGDIIISLTLILLSSPLMLVTAIGVKLSSPGPVLFRQERVGKDKRPFTMLKFRSMRTDIDHTGWSTDNDPRKTRFGSLIRKLSIDELPQLFNVLAGHMSLVGPRPELPRYVRQFKEDVPLYLVRQQVRPGMTGWAQIHGLRGNTSIETRVEYDIWYIENWSFGLDVRILLRTVFGGFINRERLSPPIEDAVDEP